MPMKMQDFSKLKRFKIVKCFVEVRKLEVLPTKFSGPRDHVGSIPTSTPSKIKVLFDTRTFSHWRE
jgi:hypothetical protein